MLSLALIVKNEEKNLVRVLDSVQGLYDELVIVDTGSTDRTVEIAERYTKNIYHFEWVNDFSKARNFSFSKCTQPWVMWLDADDALKPEDVRRIRAEFDKVSHRQDLSYLLINYNYWVEPPTLSGTVKATQIRERIIRREKAHWKGRCHEIIMVDWNQSHAIDGVAVWHLRDEEDRAADSNRNIQLMQLEIEETPSSRNYLYLGNEYVGCGKTHEAIESYSRSIEISDDINTNFQAAYKIGQCYHGLGDTDNAIIWYKKSLGYLTEYREPILGIASIYMEKEDNAKAIFWLESCLNIEEPKHPVMVVLKDNYTFIPLDMLAKAYFRTHQYEKAIEISERLYEAAPQAQILKDIELSRSALKNSYKRPEGNTRLNLGCGDKPTPGFTNVDLYYQPGVDEVFSLDVVPYADCSVDEIKCIHALEHIPRPRAERAILEWARVLKKGGKLNLKIPDLEECCRMFVEKPAEQESWYMHTIYGVQDHRDTKNAPFKDKVNFGQIHYTGFTEARLHKLLTEAGFAIDRMYKYDGYRTPSLAVEAHMPAIPQNKLKRVAFINNTLIPKYFSYGDYWEDAFKATGHHVDVFKYEQIGSLPQGYDLYFFIEANHRYDVSQIPDVYPKILYTQDTIDDRELNSFDIIATPNEDNLVKWENEGHTVMFLSNDKHIEKAQILIALKIPASQKVKTRITEIVARPGTLKSVDVVIPSYKNAEYLQLTINSIRKNSPEARIIVVNSGDDSETYNYLQSQHDIALIHSPDRLSFSQAVNKGLQASKGDVVILNNDVIVGKNWLQPLKDSPYDLTNPFSNCDQGWIHQKSMQIAGVPLKPNMFIGDVDPQAVMNTESPYHEIITRNQPQQSWVAFYATYIKRDVIEKVGTLDETFINGGEDYDFCRRAVKQGFTCGHVFSSFVFHFGGKTRKISEDENYQQHHQEDEYNNNFMKYKDRPTVAIYAGQAWEPWTIKSINTTGIGGSETCAAMLAKKFAEKGYRSILFGHCDGLEGRYDGVEYIHYTKYDKFKDSNYIDYFISSRKISPLSHKIPNGKNYVWSHDIFIPEAVNRGLPLHNVDKYICLSPWHVNFFSQHHSVPTDQIYIQGNGLDLSRYDERHTIEKDPYRLIYSSSPDRGLLTLLQMFSGWKSEFPQLNLHIFYGFDNWKKAIKHRNNPDEVKQMDMIERLIAQPGITYHGRISQAQLADEQMRASLWVYPTLFTETYCITATECMLAGAVPVCTTIAALKTTVPDGCGVKVAQPWDCSNATLDLLRNPEKQEAYRKRGEEYVLNTVGWEQTVKNWIEMFETT
jgi:glycosyltransferase involved in cell wall biosynthesis/predicted SAM-dependent methyltransferase